jgi:Protein of unknown function with PCYCGC motif
MNQSTRFHRSNLMWSACLIAAAFWAGCSASPKAGNPDAHGAHSTHATAPNANPTPRIPAFFASADAAKPLPAVLDPKQFSSPAVARAYRYAAENPAVYAQQPCYCYCDAGYQHKSLLDCFATDHSAG